MTISYEEVFKEFSAEDQQWIKRRAEELKAEELSLRDLRRLRKLTQARLSKKLKIGQEGVSRIEKRSDLYLSTLRSYLEGVGGELTLMVKFRDRPPVILAGLGENTGKKKTEIKAKKKAGNSVKSKAVTRPAA
jgi:transcriptional regulator with XRE-family HTH domain